VIAISLAPLQYQWFKNGIPLAGATNESLSLTGVRRADAGVYSVVVSNPAGAVTNETSLHVLVPQVLRGTFVPGSASFSISFSDADGGVLTAQDIGSFVVQTSTNLVEWTATNPPLVTNSNGGLSFQVPISPLGLGFYRVLSQ
jgi:hypothetical protein